MRRFELQAPDGRRFEIEADDMAAAISAYEQHTGNHSSNIPAAVGDIPTEIASAAGDALGNISKLADRGQQGPLEGLMTTGRAVLAVPELLASPLTGTTRSLLGHPIADVSSALRRGGVALHGEDNVRKAEEAAGFRVGGETYEDAKHNVDTAMSAMGSRGGPIAAAGASAPEFGPVAEAGRRLSSAVGGDVSVPVAIASDNITTQRLGHGIRNIPYAGDAIPQATSQLVQDLGDAVHTIADQHGFGSGPNVANRIGRAVREASDVETADATNAARRSDDALLAAWQRDTDAAHAGVAAREANLLEAARAAVGDMSPQDMGATLIERLRTEEATARARKDALYDRAGQADASVRADDVRNVRSIVVQGLEDAGVLVDPEPQSLTPAARNMMAELQRLSELRIGNAAVGARVPAAGDEMQAAVRVQGLEQARKRLNFLRQGATNDADRRAARHIMEQFDDWQSHVFENSLFSGSDEALRAFREARGANTAWRHRFFNDENDAGRIVTRIVTGEVTPQEVANYIIGAGQVGAKGVSSRLLTHIAEATNSDPEAMQAIRSGIWNKLTQTADGTPKSASKTAGSIAEFQYGSGRDIAQRLFTPEQQRLMRAYSDTLRSGEDARLLIGEVSQATKPSAMEVPPGPMKQLADAVIGKGGRTDEALFGAIDAYAKSGSRGDIGTLAKLVRAIPQQDRTDLAGAIIRNLGVSPRTGQFSPDVFLSQWKTYTPQAKAILFGNAGSQRQALDDIAIISDRLKDVERRFGNPSGTAQNRNLFALGTGLLTAPLTTLASVAGGSVVAKILAAPAGASSAAKWAKAYATLPGPSHSRDWLLSDRIAQSG